MITAPYNFVPLNKDVFYPDWAEDISHDIPFKDGESGEIDITITAKSPIFVRNHSKDKENPTDEFCHHINENGAKEFYIPASSFKGMVRNVLEILSFSKINIDEKTYKDVFGVRDMTNPKELVGGADACGFLVEENNEYYIEDCGKILTISHFDLQNTFRNIKKLESAKEKNEKFGLLKEYKIETYKKMMDVRGKQIPKDMAKISNNTPKVGTLVFTGDINNKKHEFIFVKNGKKIKLDKKVFQNFSKIYLENEDSIDGQFWKNKFKTTKKIPVFYKKVGEKVENIGLTQLFKLAYNKSILEAAKQNTDKSKLDLAQRIFGYVDGEKALKGRVYFSHFKSTLERYEQQKPKEEVLGTPNPTYYPNYIKQVNISGNTVNKYTTLMDKNAEISGWKRYPLHSTIKHNPAPTKENGSVNHDITTKFKPLPEDTVFKGKLRFHNLKKAEIGALLSAITFHGQSDKCLHNIGMAKSLGYGKIAIKLDIKNLKSSQNEYLDEFENLITQKIPNWKGSSQLKELFSMANINTISDKDLGYQLLENPKPKYYSNNNKPEKNDFVGAKKAKEYLLPHSKGKIENSSPKSVPNQATKKPVENKVNQKTNNTQQAQKQEAKNNFEELLARNNNNVKQMANNLKAGHFDKLNINKKELAKKLIEELKKDLSTWDSIGAKNIERRKFLEDLIKG